MSTEAANRARDDERLAMLAALVNGDVPLAYRIAMELLAYGVPFDDIVIDVLSPVQEELGRRWATGDLGIADEHAASAAVDDLLVRLGATAGDPRVVRLWSSRAPSTTPTRSAVGLWRAHSRSRAIA